MRKPFHMSGSFNGIDTGTVTAIGDTGLFWVQDRTATGVLGSDEIGGLESDIEGTFSMTYDAIVNGANQKGPFWGMFEIHDDEKDEDYSAFFQARSVGELISFDPETGGSMDIEIEGRLWFTENAVGRATFEGSVEVALDEGGHIAGILDSTLIIEGSWIPDIGNRWNSHLASRWFDGGVEQATPEVHESTDLEAILV